MGDWSILSRLLTEVQHHSTVIGKIWLTVLLIFRILLVTLVGEVVYSDEQSKFTCNTLQPGCNNVCYDTFAPVSHLRFWVFQIVLVSTPSIFYIVYLLHKITSNKRLEAERKFMELLPSSLPDNVQHREILSFSQRTEDSCDIEMSSKAEDHIKRKCTNEVTDNTERSSSKMLMIYITHVILRLALEIGFLSGQYYLFGFEVPHIFHCQTYPCPTQTDCFVSRATEKTIFLNFMFGVSLTCFLLNIVELHYLGWNYIFQVMCSTCFNCSGSVRRQEDGSTNCYSGHNIILKQLRNSTHEKLVPKTSPRLSQQKLGYSQTNQATISFSTNSAEITPNNLKAKHKSVTKLVKSKKSWL
ncbi:gap junction delta-2 protein-like [Protopterus annectens]|uniref:gap junction delta-2 protein-like n=1 Tax=Protopterus annectens TaxID=7888 RepID=UPI001CFB2533|nr:gap junction delta-2 protein-like [Protopterus annectens]